MAADVENKGREAPSNIEAEQALLGAILINNDALHRCGDIQPQHFYEPLHAQIFEAILASISAGVRANPVTLRQRFADFPAIGAVTVPQYLGRLVAHATSVMNARDYAQTVRDLWARRELIAIGEAAVNQAYDGHDVPVDVQIDAAERALFDLSGLGVAKSHEMTAAQAVDESLKMVEAAFKRDGHLAGLSTGFRDLDARTGGLAPESLVILAGRPSMGKSALAANIAFNVAKALDEKFRTVGDLLDDGGKRQQRGEVSFYSLEMSAEQIMQRQFAAESGISVDRQRRGAIREDSEAREFSMLADVGRRLRALPLHIDATGALSVSQLVTRARRRKRLHDTRLIVVDYLQLMVSDRAYGNRVSEVSEISMNLKAIAKELQIPVLALSQLSRAVEQREDKRPQLSDLRESGAIEQDADLVMFVYREEYYLVRSEPKNTDSAEWMTWNTQMNEARGLAEIGIAKHRHGSTGAVTMQFDGERTAFSDLDRTRA